MNRRTAQGVDERHRTPCFIGRGGAALAVGKSVNVTWRRSTARERDEKSIEDRAHAIVICRRSSRPGDCANPPMPA